MKYPGYVTRPQTSLPAGVNTTIVTPQPGAQRERAGVRLMRLPDGSLTADLQGYYDYDRQQVVSHFSNE